ncbi:hypothetical protein TNCV_2207601 [Trichonephila clavipes]|uniref:Uncharacterized protein n=1 Tax=Trichonephila clavipes TaxID=2585209 RepID=A0A8X6VAE4_TRICX|nr:hypothetical protein TNCV_2207601 [Trichonephila clavipes]
MRTIGDGPRHFDVRSIDEDDIPVGTPTAMKILFPNSRGRPRWIDKVVEGLGRLKTGTKGDNIEKRFLTTEETRLYRYDPTIKQQSSEGKHPSSPTPKKAKTCEIGW